MSLSSCPDCWDTPCQCGRQGYVVVYLHEYRGYFKALGLEERERIRKALADRLVELLAGYRGKDGSK